MKYFVNSVKIEEFINNCNSHIDEMISQCNVMRDIINKTNWQGNAYDAASFKYSKIMEEVDEIPKVLGLYIRFMEIVIENYGEGTDKIKKEFQELVEKNANAIHLL